MFPSNSIFLLAPSLILARALPARAAEPTWELRALIQEALDANPMLRATRLEAEALAASAGPRGAYEDPVIGYEAQNYPVDTWSAREFGMTGNQLSLAQKIPFPGKLGHARREVELRYDARREAYRARQLELIREVKRSYLELYHLQQKREILAERGGLVRTLIAGTRNRYAVGKVSQAELLNLQLEEAGLLGQGLATERQLEGKRADLSALLGRERSSLPGRAAVPVKQVIDFNRTTEDSLLTRALAHSPELGSATTEVQAAEAGLSRARWGYLPDFEVKLGYTFRQPSAGDRGVDFVSAGVGMTLPLWAFSRQAGEVRMAAAEHARSEALLDGRRQELVRALHDAYAGLREAAQRLDLYETGMLPLARQSVASARTSYLAGRMEYATLLNVISARYQTELDYHETMVSYETRIAELETLVGDGLDAGARP